jgi:hypothetical protein
MNAEVAVAVARLALSSLLHCNSVHLHVARVAMKILQEVRRAWARLLGVIRRVVIRVPCSDR